MTSDGIYKAHVRQSHITTLTAQSRGVLGTDKKLM